MYFRSNPTYMTTVRQRHERVDGRTDGRLTVAIPPDGKKSAPCGKQHNAAWTIFMAVDGL